jgi:glycosyltransferase 2 family protein
MPAPGRVRRPTDLLLAVLSAAVIAVVLGSITTLPLGSGEVADDVSHWLRHIPSWLAYTAAVTAEIGGFAFAIVVFIMLGRRQWRDARNAAVAAATGAAAAIVASTVWRAENGAVAQAVLHGSNPANFVVDTAFIAFLVGTDLTRRSRWKRWCSTSGTALLVTGLAKNQLTPFAVVIALCGGLLAGWIVRWLLGSASARPGPDEMGAWLTRHHLAPADLAVSGRRGQAHLEGTLADATSIEVLLANRDTRGSGLARRLWAIARLRPVAAGHIALSSRSQLEHLALASALARQASVICPAVLLLDETPSGSLALVLAQPSGHPLDAPPQDRPPQDGKPGAGQPAADPPAPVSPAVATALFTALRALHDAGIAHRDLRLASLLVTGDSAGFARLDSAVPGASTLARRLDVAQLLATLGTAATPAEAVRALRAGYGPVDETSIAAVLQPIALAPWGWSAMRAARGCLTEVRQELVGTEAAMPVARLERFRWRTVVSTVALTVAAYLLIGQLSQVNLLGTLGHVNYGWFALALFASAVTYLAAAENLAAFVPKKLSLVRGFLVQLSSAFVGVAMPPTVGHVAVNARYLHRQGVDEGSIGVAVALSQLVNVITTIPLLVVLGLLTGSGLSRFKIAPGGDVLLGVAAIAVAVGILLAVPLTRDKITSMVWPHLRSAWPRLLDAVSHPLRLALSAGANLLLTFSYVVAFVASLLAVGAHPALLPAAVVFLAGNTVGSAAPTPGGLGAVEAVLAAGLTAMGIPAHEAIPAVLVFRIATFWLPIPAGWVSYLVLQRRGTL